MNCHDWFKLSEMLYLALKIVLCNKQANESNCNVTGYSTLLEHVNYIDGNV